MTKIISPAVTIVASLGFYLLLTSSFFLLDSLSPFDAKRILQLVLFAGVLIFTVVWPPLRTATITQLNRLSKLSKLILALFFFIGITSSLRLDNPGYALVDVSMMFIIMLLIAVTAASRDLLGHKFDKWAVLLLAITGFSVAVQEMMGFVAGWVAGFEFNYTYALIHFAHPRFYNQLQTWFIPTLAVLPLIFPDKRWLKFGCIALLGLQWFLVIAVAARGTIVSLFVAMAFIAWWLPDVRGYWLKKQLMGIMAGALIFLGILFLNSLLLPQAESGSFYAHSVGRPMAHTSGRSALWQLSVDDAIAHPFLGTGPTRYACDSTIVLPAHPHNFLLRILGEWGAIAFLLVLTLALTIGLGFLNNLKSPSPANNTTSILRAAIATSLIAGVIHACLSGLFIMPASQIAAILIAGWALSLSGKSNLPPKSSQIITSLLIAGMSVACVTLVFAAREIPQLSKRTNYAKHYGPMVPRFWQNGRACEYNYSQPEPTK